MYDEIEAKKTAKPEWHLSTDRDIDFKRTYSRKYYDYAVRYVINEVNYHKICNKGKFDLDRIKLFLKSKYSLLRMRLLKNTKLLTT